MAAVTQAIPEAGTRLLREATEINNVRLRSAASPANPEQLAKPRPGRSAARFTSAALDVRGAVTARATDLLFVALSLAVIGCWLALYRWYSISGHYEIPYFAFEKIQGGLASPTLRWTLVLFVALAVLYAVGYWLIWRAPTVSLAVKLATVGQVAAAGVINVLIFPVGALDIFRYGMGLKLFYFYHENPYVHGFMSHRDDPFGEHGFLNHLPNAKGPAWLLLSAIPSYLTGFDDPVRFLEGLKAFNLVLLALTAWEIYRYLGGGRRGWVAVYGFLANPLVLFEGVGNGHNDVMVALFLIAALLALRGRSWLALPLVMLSALVKYFTFQLLPLFLVVMLARRWGWRRVALAVAGSGVVTIALVAPFWDGGEMLRGIKRVNEAYEESAHVSIISLTRQYLAERRPLEDIPALRPIFAALFMLLALPVLWAAGRGRAIEKAAVDLLLLFLLLLTLLYPWYLIPVFGLMVLRPSSLSLGYLFVATGLGLVSYPVSVWARFESGYSTLDRHLVVALFLTAPILIFLALEAGCWVVRFRRWRGGASEGAGSRPRRRRLRRTPTAREATTASPRAEPG